MNDLVPTASTSSDWERSPPATMTCAVGLGMLFAVPASAVPFYEWGAEESPHYQAVSARNDLRYGDELSGTRLSMSESSPFRNFNTAEESPMDPTSALYYVGSMAFLPLDEAAETAADKYFAKKAKKPRRVVIPARV